VSSRGFAAEGVALRWDYHGFALVSAPGKTPVPGLRSRPAPGMIPVRLYAVGRRAWGAVLKLTHYRALHRASDALP
jgi:hypothetical protein